MQGFSMIELLVAMVVLAIGLLGMAGLQTAGLSNNQSAYFRSQASIAINDLIDRMRANTEGIKNGHYQANFDTDGTVPADPGCISGGCTAQQLADYDKREWTKLFKVLDGSTPILPGARGQIEYIPATNLYRFTITWNEMTWSSGSQPKDSQVQTLIVGDIAF
jgi:type IV pilus assembly protein PilV